MVISNQPFPKCKDWVKIIQLIAGAIYKCLAFKGFQVYIYIYIWKCHGSWLEGLGTWNLGGLYPPHLFFEATGFLGFKSEFKLMETLSTQIYPTVPPGSVDWWFWCAWEIRALKIARGIGRLSFIGSQKILWICFHFSCYHKLLNLHPLMI